MDFSVMTVQKAFVLMIVLIMEYVRIISVNVILNILVQIALLNIALIIVQEMDHVLMDIVTALMDLAEMPVTLKNVLMIVLQMVCVSMENVFVIKIGMD